jgi:type III pantothenate kinase
MLLTIDIGNSAIKFGVFDGESLVSKLVIPTDREYTADDIAQSASALYDFPIGNAIACSVVPRVDQAVSDFALRRFGIDTFFVDNSFDLGLTIRYETVETLGTDRLVNAFAAAEKHGTPVIVCSLGTATTIDAVSESREYLGGVIAPGVSVLSEALHLKAPKLPKVETAKPEHVIGRSTVTSIQSGIFYGYASLVDGLVTRISAEFALSQNPKVVATGGMAELIAPACPSIDAVEPDLLLNGLNILHSRLAGRSTNAKIS